MQPPALQTEDWLDLALDELTREGYGALKALPLSKKLNVTRGSFYHHFDSLEAFHTAVIAHWSKRSSGALIENALNAEDPRQALEDLLQITLRSGEKLERSVRSWATVQPQVALEVERVDQARIRVAQTLMARAGLPESQTIPRSKLLYWAAIGRLMMPFPNNNLLTDAEIKELAQLMLSN